MYLMDLGHGKVAVDGDSPDFSTRQLCNTEQAKFLGVCNVIGW